MGPSDDDNDILAVPMSTGEDKDVIVWPTSSAELVVTEPHAVTSICLSRCGRYLLHISAARRSACTISDPRHSRVPQRQLAAKLPCVPPSHPHESSPRTPGRKGEDAAT